MSLKNFLADAALWAAQNPGKASRIDEYASVSMAETRVLERLRDGGMTASKLLRGSRVSLRHLDVNFDYQGTQVLTSLTASSPYTTVFSLPLDSVWALNT